MDAKKVKKYVWMMSPAFTDNVIFYTGLKYDLLPPFKAVTRAFCFVMNTLSQNIDQGEV